MKFPFLRYHLPQRSKKFPGLRRLPLSFEILEQRIAPATVNWTGAAGDLNWNTANNWDSDSVPSSSDTAVIKTAGITIKHSSQDTSIQAITSAASLDISGGSFKVTSGSSSITGSLTVEAGVSLTATGSATTFTASSTTTLNGASLFADSGARLNLTQTTSYSGGSNSSTIQANRGSTIDLSGVTTLAGGSKSAVLSINAYNGSTIKFGGVSTYSGGATQIYAEDQGTTIDLSQLPKLTSDANNDSSLEEADSGSILVPNLTSISNTSLEVTGSNTTFSIAKLSNVDGENLTANNGATLALPDVTSYTGVSAHSSTLYANGGTLDLSNVTTLNGGPSGAVLYLDAYNAGSIKLGSVTSYTGGATQVYSEDQGTTIDLSQLPKFFSDANNDSSLEEAYSGTILLSDLTSISDTNLEANGSNTTFTLSGLTNVDGENLTADNGATLSLPEVTSYSGVRAHSSTLYANGGTLDLSNVTTLNGGPSGAVLYLDAYNAGDIKLGSVTSYTGGATQVYAEDQGTTIDLSQLPKFFSDANNDSSLEEAYSGTILLSDLTSISATNLEANGSNTTFTLSKLTNVDGENLTANNGATLALPDVTSYSGVSAHSSTLYANGGTLDLSNVTTLNGGLSGAVLYLDAYNVGDIKLGAVTNYTGGATQVYAEDQGTTIDLSQVPKFFSDANNDSSLEEADSGSILVPDLTSISNTNLEATGSNTTFSIANLPNVDGASLTADNGATLALPDVTSYTGVSAHSSTLYANGGTLDLSNVTTLNGGPSGAVLYVDAYNAGDVKLGSVTSYTGGATQVYAQDQGTVIDLSGIPAFFSDANNFSSLEATTGAQINLTSGLVTLTRTNVEAASNGTISGGTLKLISGTLSGSGTIEGNVINGGGTVQPGTGKSLLTITGNYTQYAEGSLTVYLGGTTAGTNYDQLAVGGSATLAGTLNVYQTNGYSPKVGDSLQIVTFTSHSGDFTTKNGLNTNNGRFFRTLYDATDLNLTVAAADVRVTPTTGLYTSKQGDAAQFTVVLASKPTANVTLPLSSSNTSEGIVSPSSLIFTSSNWNVPQTVTVRGQNDNASGSVAYTVSFGPVSSNDLNYSGLTIPAVSLTNLPNEVRDIQVSNLAVKPSTGLNKGSQFVVSWTDTNDGTLPTSALWNDQIVITNTTTGATLTTANVSYDPNLYGALQSNGTLAQQFTFTLPTTVDGVGNIQVTISADVDHTAYLQTGSLVNANLRSYSGGSNYPTAPSTLTVGGVDFTLLPDGTTASSTGIIQTPSGTSSYDMPVNITGASTVYTLINSVYGTFGDTVGSVEFKGANGADATFNLVEGTNIRDHYNDGYNNSIASGTPSASFGNGADRLDMQTFELPGSFANTNLTDIIFNGSGGNPQGEPFLAAVTVATGSKSSDFVLLGAGVAPDSTNSQTVTVVSGSVVPGQVSIALDSASDSGAKGDGLTDVKTPTFDVTVNEPGTIVVDYKSDGTSTASLAVTASGTYSFTAPSLADGTYTTAASFTPTAGTAASAKISTTIDTSIPTLEDGSPNPQGPLYTRTLTFSKNMDATTIGSSAILVSGPGVTGSVNPSQVTGSGTTYTVTFANPLTKGGNYTLQLASTITDRAGNSIGTGVADTFNLIQDTTPPTIASVSPSGLTNANVSSLTVTFDKAIDPSTFTSAEVGITTPSGTIGTSAITVTEINASTYTVAFPPQTQEATYDVSLGGSDVLDISGNAMTAAYQTSFTIDHTPPTVSSVSPTGTVNTLVTGVDVTFSKAMNTATLNGDNISLIAPDGSSVSVGSGFLVSGTTYHIPVATQRANGTYTLVVGTGVQDLAGSQLGTADTFSDVFTIALPDLVVSGVSASTSSAQFGDTVTVNWTVTNKGAADATGPWNDGVYLSTTPTLSGAIYLGSANTIGSAIQSPNGFYNGQASVTLPLTPALASGTYYLVVQTDSGGLVNESDVTTQLGSTSIALTEPPPPDLSTSSVTTSLTTGQPGQSETVNWTVTNIGGSPAPGSWTDDVYLSPDGKLSDATLLGSVTDQNGLAPNGSYQGTLTKTLTSSLADGTYQVIVVADAGDAVSTDPNRGNNQSSAAHTLTFGHVDLVPTITVAATSATSGDLLSVQWSTKNQGTATTLNGWVDRAYLSTTKQVTGSSLLLGTSALSGPLRPNQSVSSSASAPIPIGDSGTYYVIVVADAENSLIEPNGQSSTAVQSISITLAPYADLAVSNVSAPTQTIGDPAYPTISWKVTNVGTGVGQTTTWTDEVIASPTDNVDDPDAVILGRYTHTGGLAVGPPGYTQTQTIQMPPGFSGRYHLFVETDAGDVVFENGSKANNVAAAPNHFDVMPIPYADLVVSSVNVNQPAYSSQPVNITWTVTNQGIGLTSTPSWGDDVALSSDAAGTNIIKDYGLFNHLGPIGPGESYTRIAQVTLPDGLSGTYYVIITAASYSPPYEFIYGNGTDNVSKPTAFPINLTPPPDLTVSSVSAPTSAQEGSSIDVSWTVKNVGTGDASGSWQDEIVMQPVGQPTAPYVILGQYSNFGGLAAGKSYSRTESITLPTHINQRYNVEVITNFDNELFENGATANNLGIAPQALAVSVMPRPDLQAIIDTIPTQVDAGGTFSVTYSVINQGNAPTTNRWDDKVYLSLTPEVTDDSILIQQLPNQTALGTGDQYEATTIPVVVPLRYRGQVYVIVVADGDNQVDQWPNGTHDQTYQALYVNPQPLPDLVLSNVVAPTQEIAGSTFNVSYTVTNLGDADGTTLVDSWTDSVWLTRDKTRPIPGQGDILLTEVAHTGALVNKAGYDNTVSVTLPDNLDPGTYYITPWTDLYSAVLQDSLAVNVNPDDPNNLNSENYKAQQIQILAPLPDLQVTTVKAPSSAKGGDTITVSWTVANTGTGIAQPSGWLDTVYLTSNPTNPLDPGATTMTLGSVQHNVALNPDESYNASLTVQLSPSAIGKYIVVYTDAPQDNFPTPVDVVKEINENNNSTATPCTVTPIPADLVVTSVSIPQPNYSGEKMTFSYTVTNNGPNAVWSGTQYWTDFLWVSQYPTFMRSNASFLGQTTHFQAPNAPLLPGQSYTVTTTVTLPAGTGGQYYLYIDLDAHNDFPPYLYTYTARQLLTDWWPASTGNNSDWLDQFNHWAFEDPNNNRSTTPFDIIYREPDLTVTNITVPSKVISGTAIPITYTVTNQGTRATRVTEWTDGVFLSQDPSLDIYDTELNVGGYSSNVGLQPGASYTYTVNVRVPDGIHGPFYVIVYADSDATVDYTMQSNIGYGLYGVQIGATDELDLYDLASASIRSLGRGKVPQYENEADKIVDQFMPITLAPAPDLQVTSVSANANNGHVIEGQTLDVTYTVSNRGASTPPTEASWNDLIYFSRDTNLDLKADRYLSPLDSDVTIHGNGLGAGASYTVTAQVQVPIDLSGPYYLFVITDPPTDDAIGQVFEGGGANEDNNSNYLTPPLIIDPPPPSQIAVTSVQVPDPSTIKSGDPFTVSWTVQDTSPTNPAVGPWSDAVYLGTGTTWNISDVYLGTVGQTTGTLQPGQSYTDSLTTNLPSVTPGEYHIIVRADIYNQISLPQGVPVSSKTTASADLLTVAVDSLQLGVPYPTTLSTDQERLLQVTVPQGATLQVSLNSAAANSANEIFIKQGSAPTDSNYDAAYQGGLSPDQVATVPSTVPGVYYILIRGHSEPGDDIPVTVLARLLPLSVSNVDTDQGGDSQYVTTIITGAQFQPNALVKLVMPGFAEYQPVSSDFVNSTEIVAEFDLTGAPYGSYDVRVTNPDGSQAIAPYRFEIEQTVAPDVTIGIGGPRFILAGDSGTYSVALQNLGNINAPYVEFNVGIPQLSNVAPPPDPSQPLLLPPVNVNVYGLPYVEFTTNLGGSPPDASLAAGVPYATLQGSADTAAANGHFQAPGYLFNEAAGGFTGFTFDVTTYPGLAAMNDQNLDALKAEFSAAFPKYANLLNGSEQQFEQALNDISPSLAAAYTNFGAVPAATIIPYIPFQFDINASATTLTRAEFVTQSLQQADQLRTAILADSTAPQALQNLAANQTVWENLYLAALEQAGVLLPDGTTPPVRQDPLIMSVMATLATGVLAGPAGSGIIPGGNVAQFFGELLQWYGNNMNQTAPVASFNIHGNPVATLPTAGQFNLNAQMPTSFEDFNVYVPWLAWDQRANLPPSFQITSVQDVNGQPVIPLDLSQYLHSGAQDAGLASMTGPFTAETNDFIPTGQPLPFTVNFQNDPTATTSPGTIRITTRLDPNLDPSTFRLGDIQIGNIDVHIPSNLGLFQGDFDFTQPNGFILRVSAGIDLQTRTATWLLQAIDPLTGLAITDPSKGLLPPNNAEGFGAGYVTYTVEPNATATTGAIIRATSTVLFSNAPPQNTAPLTYTLDTAPPTTQVTVTQLGTAPNYQVQWKSVDDPKGSGVKSVTLYVSKDGGAYQIWQDQVTQASGTMIYQGQAGHTYNFLVLGTDIAGNHEQPPAAANVPQDTTTVNLGALPTVPSTTPPNFGMAPAPTVQPSTNPLFTQAEKAVPSAPPTASPSEFKTVLQPFQAQSFATGFDISDSILGPMALAQAPDGSIFISGGASRNELFHVPQNGGPDGTPLATLPYQIFALAFDNGGNLWATTGGGPLLQLDPTTGAIVNAFGDGVTLALTVDPKTEEIYVSSGKGVEIFDPSTDTFTQYSRDQNLRVSSLAFDNLGNLWAVTYPDQRQIVEFDDHARAQVMLTFDSDVQSIAFGQQGTYLDNLLFVTHNDATNTAPGTVAPTPTELTMVDVTTLQQVQVAQGGTRGFAAFATSDGRLLISQSHEVDVLEPVVPPTVEAVNPPKGSIAALPLGFLSVTFDQAMYAGAATDSSSVTDPANYSLVGDATGKATIASVQYNPSTHTALLLLDGLPGDHYILTVKNSIVSANRVPMLVPYITDFTGVSNLASFVKVSFYDARSDRADGTVSFDVSIQNIGGYSLFLPLFLVLDPAQGFNGVPENASESSDGRWLINLNSTLSNGVDLQPGQITTGSTVTIADPNQLKIAYTPDVSGTRASASAPVFDSAPSTSISAGAEYRYQAAAHDPDGSTPEFLLVSGPSGMTLNATTDLLTWATQPTSPATVTVALYAYDPSGSYTQQQFVINVGGGTHDPVISPLPSQVFGQEGQPLVLPVSATDPDGRPLVYWANNLPGGASFDPTSHTLLWNPDYGQAGTYNDVTFFVSDGVNTVSTSITLLIAPAPPPPVLSAPPDQTLLVGDHLRFTLQGSDADGYAVSYSSNALPANATLDPLTGVFDWPVGFDQAGTFTVPFTVISSSGLTTTQTATYTVLPAPAAPIFNPLQSWQVNEGQPISFSAMAVDPHNPTFQLPTRLPDQSLSPYPTTQPTVTYQVSGLPTGATFDLNTTLFNWTPGNTQTGTYNVVFTASNNGYGGPLSTSLTVPITVLIVNHAPVVTPVTDLTIPAGQPFDQAVSAVDPDGNPLTLSVSNGISGYALPGFVTLTDNGNGTGVLHFNPPAGNRGTYTLTLAATDNGDGLGAAGVLTGTNTFIVTVQSSTQLPTLNYVGPRVAIAGQPFTLNLQAGESDQNNLTWSITGLPLAATLTPSSFYGAATLNWTPTSADIGSYHVTFTVTDTGNSTTQPSSVSQTIRLVVRATDTAPVFPTTAPTATVAEGQTLSLLVTATKIEGDSLFYTATNLPSGANLDPATGMLTWTPQPGQAGTYPVIVTATDGSLSSSETVKVAVTHANYPPVFVPLLPQYAREGTPVQFTVVAADLDGGPGTYTLTNASAGSTFNAASGVFQWTPSFGSAGDYTLHFVASNPAGLTSTLDVVLHVAHVVRPPTVHTPNHQATLGELLRFTVQATDLDAGTTLTYTAINLPAGATLDPHAGLFQWTPGPSQTGDYVVTLQVSDGQATSTQNILIRSSVQPQTPSVTIALTPSFPAIPGQKVTVNVIASSVAPITGVALTVNGQPVTLDSIGRATITAGAPSQTMLAATATDQDGLVGTATAALKVRDPQDTTPPVVSFDPTISNATLTSTTAILATVSDSNLDSWTLEIATPNNPNFTILATGQTTVNDGALAVLDPSNLSNGFYQLLLTARDISGRTTQTQTQIEVDTATKPNDYVVTDTDLSVGIGGTTINIQRSYDSLTRNGTGDLGYGWQFVNRDTNLQTNVPLTGQEEYGVYNAFRAGTELYLTLPTGQRVRFTFAPTSFQVAGQTFYTPAWQSYPGVSYTLASTNAVLTASGSRYYDLATGQPYNPGNLFFGGPNYTLTAPDGTRYQLDANGEIIGEVTPNGSLFFISASGITSANGQTIQFLRDDQGRITSIVTPGGQVVIYQYDSAGNLVAMQNQFTGGSQRYGYSASDPHLLIAATRSNGNSLVIQPGTTTTAFLDDDLGGAAQFSGRTVDFDMTAGAVDRFAFRFDQNELNSTATGTILLRVLVQGTSSGFAPGVPTIAGLTPRSVVTQGNQCWSPCSPSTTLDSMS